MARLKVKDRMSILEAVDYLSSLSEVDGRLVQREIAPGEEDTLHPYRWLDQHLVLKNQEIMQEVYSAVHHYIKELCEKHSEHLKDKQIIKGLHSIINLVGESIEKIDRFTDLFKESPALESASDIKQYKTLKSYLASFLLPQLPETHEAWEEDLGIHEEDLIGIKKKGINDLEDVKEDRSYELFYLKKEDRKPFYDYDMLRRLKQLYDFDEMLTSKDEDSSFIRIRQLQDKDFQQKASRILSGLSHLIEDFYKNGMKSKGVPLVAAVNKALMSLMLAANPRNRFGNQPEDAPITFKTSAEYFGDFHRYLRVALLTADYKKILSAKAEGGHPLSVSCFFLVHKLCASYFLTISLQKDTVDFIKRMIDLGSKISQVKKPSEKDGTYWKELLWEDDAIRSVLNQQPSGPVKRIVESFLKGEIGAGWDPLSHKNTPSHLFSFHRENKEVAFLRMPAPLRQKSIRVAEVTLEFRAFLRGCLLGDRHEKFLLVNLQNRTSWEEHGRSLELEKLTTQEEHKKAFSLIGIPKKTEFYHQSGPYQDLTEAKLFIEQLLEQFKGGEQCGFYWPEEYGEEGIEFAKKATTMIHKFFFEQKKNLTLFQRQHFIDIFYFFLELKALDLLQPDYLALTCKDGVDTGAASNAEFFACLRMMISKKPWTSEEKDLLLWILYSPALFFRQRAIQKDELHRLISVVDTFQEVLESNREDLLKECKKLYPKGLWEEIEIKTPLEEESA